MLRYIAQFVVRFFMLVDYCWTKKRCFISKILAEIIDCYFLNKAALIVSITI